MSQPSAPAPPSLLGSLAGVALPSAVLLSGKWAPLWLGALALAAGIERLASPSRTRMPREAKAWAVALAFAALASVATVAFGSGARDAAAIGLWLAALVFVPPALSWLVRNGAAAGSVAVGLGLAAAVATISASMAAPPSFAAGTPARAAGAMGLAVAGAAAFLVARAGSRSKGAALVLPASTGAIASGAWLLFANARELTAVTAEQRLSPVMAFALVPMLAAPAWHFAWAARHRFEPLRRTGRAGLALTAAAVVAGAFGHAFAPLPTATLYLVAVALLYVQAARREREHYALPVKRSQTLSVTIITLDEADRIGRCLNSVVGWADEIVVLDSGSKDDTVAIARRYTPNVWGTDWPGYGPQKQRALERATCAWVLSLDADEELTPELRHDIDTELGPEPACVAYELPWAVVAFGRVLDFGRSARAPLRLFVREGSRFTDAQVHEKVLTRPGPVGRLRGRLLHYTHRDYGHAIAKVARYGWLGAQRRHTEGRRSGGVTGAVLRALITFVQVGVIRGGLLDGAAGFVTAVHYARVSFDKYAGLWDLERSAASRMPAHGRAQRAAAPAEQPQPAQRQR